jgi:hypothetical protein
MIELVDDGLLSMAKGASKITFSLNLNGQDLAGATVVMTNVQSAWKVEN